MPKRTIKFTVGKPKRTAFNSSKPDESKIQIITEFVFSSPKENDIDYLYSKFYDESGKPQPKLKAFRELFRKHFKNKNTLIVMNPSSLSVQDYPGKIEFTFVYGGVELDVWNQQKKAFMVDVNKLFKL